MRYQFIWWLSVFDWHWGEWMVKRDSRYMPYSWAYCLGPLEIRKWKKDYPHA